MGKEVIFFDIGHTLVTGADLSPRRILGSRLNLSEKETKRIGRLIMTHSCSEPDSLLAAMAKILPDQDRAEMKDVLETVWEEQIKCAREIEGATALLGSLRAEGFGLGVISNIWHPFYLGFCEACSELRGMLDYELELLSYRLGLKKPSTELFREAVKRTGAAAGSCWMVGDSTLDMCPAMETGMNTVWVLSRPDKERHILARLLRGELPAPTLAVENLHEVYPFIMEGRRDL